MTMLITNGTDDYDGSGAPLTATGAIVVTFSGSKGIKSPVLTMYSRSDTARFAPMYQRNRYGRFKVNLANADDYYFKVTVPNGVSVDLAVANV